MPCDLELTGVTENTVSLKWVEPEDDGGSPLTGYILERREATRKKWGNGMETEEMEYTITGLTENKPYYVRVAAKNDIGTGPFAEYPETITPKCPHGEILAYYMLGLFLV